MHSTNRNYYALSVSSDCIGLVFYWILDQSTIIKYWTVAEHNGPNKWVPRARSIIKMIKISSYSPRTCLYWQSIINSFLNIIVDLSRYCFSRKLISREQRNNNLYVNSELKWKANKIFWAEYSYSKEKLVRSQNSRFYYHFTICDNLPHNVALTTENAVAVCALEMTHVPVISFSLRTFISENDLKNW